MGSSPSLDGADQATIRLGRQDSPYLRVLFVTIFVRDQDRSLRFYLDQLGFSLVVDKRFDGGGRFVAVAPPDGTAILALATRKLTREESKPMGRSRGVVFFTEDLPAKFRDWSKRGVRFHHPPQRTAWGGMSTTFEDVDGNSFGLVSSDEMIREVESRRRAIAEKLEAERRSAQELEIARQVQARLFPQTLPPLRTLDYAGLCLQARAVGGDYFDFLRIGRERVGLVLGDISGKGIAAALLMASLQANLRSQGSIPLGRPQRALRSVNQFFYENTTESAYATLFFAEYVDKLRLLRYANCGHPSPLLLRSNGTLERLESTCTVLGLFPDWECSVEERRLYPGDTLALYTDGITESRNAGDEEFGVERLIDALRRNRDLPSQSLLMSIVDDVRKFSPLEQHDDITLIVAKCRRN